MAFTIDSRMQHSDDKFSIRGARYHLVLNDRHEAGKLFDLTNDPAEKVNLYGGGLEVEADLRGRLVDWISDYRAKTLAAEDPDTELIDARMAEDLRALGYIE
ncbi:MAG: hypothetical protein JRG92_14530 [Deltaproteobacteria bacterium]|nr:hypothetical protein [Deltaproteobacteria bacterium]MBW2697334.1 hypothetical protein [Deltaproteobacteria bacterium]